MKQVTRMFNSVVYRRAFMTIAVAATVFMSSCNDDDPEPVNEEELITTVTLTFQRLNDAGESDGSAPFSATWKDLGNGSPQIQGITLGAHRQYRMIVSLLDESKTPAVDIDDEVREEDEAHQFFFSSTVAGVAISYDDSDGDGRPVGLVGLVVTVHEGTGSFNVMLRHEPNKSAAGVSDGDPANAGGETDVEVEFPLTVVE